MIITDIKPYEKNAKQHSRSQIDKIVESIKRFGFNVPIVLDSKNEIIAGHGRLEASRILGFEEVKLGVARAKVGERFIPAILVDDLTEEEIKAYRLADNKLNESEWNIVMVEEELKILDVELINLTGFDINDVDAKIRADEINELSKQRDIDLGKYNVITVEAPDAPRLKARMSFYFENIEDFEKVKKLFKLKGGELDSKKLLEII